MKTLLSAFAAVAVATSLHVVAADEAAPEERRPLIVAHKELNARGLEAFVEGRPFEVVYYLLNVGDGTATGVKLTDEWPTDTFEVVEQWSKPPTWDELKPGANETTSLVLKCKVRGRLTVSPARIDYTYSVPVEGDVADEVTGEVEVEDVKWTTYSSKPAGTHIISEGDYGKLAVDTTTIYSLAAAAAAVLLVVTGSKVKAAKRANGRAAYEAFVKGREGK